MTSLVRAALEAAERGWVPDAAVRAGVRRLARSRLRKEKARAARPDTRRALPFPWADARPRPGRSAVAREAIEVVDAREGIAPVPEKANEQHYEVPAEFFRVVLGPKLKYSCALWEGATTLAGAEDAMLERTAARARLADGQRVLDLGCGWGSLALWAAERYPGSRFLAVSNSRSQRRFIRDRARERGLTNVEARTADVNRFRPEGRFDRIVSVEMMEHVRDHPRLFRRLSRWLAPDGRLFVHVFCHRTLAYPFESEGPGDWMARRFFTGGVMPSAATLPAAARLGAGGALRLEGRWLMSGEHYARTAEAWLRRLDARAAEARAALAAAPGNADPERLRILWRLFFLGVAGTFGYREGSEWGVSHYRWRLEAGAEDGRPLTHAPDRPGRHRSGQRAPRGPAAPRPGRGSP